MFFPSSIIRGGIFDIAQRTSFYVRITKLGSLKFVFTFILLNIKNVLEMDKNFVLKTQKKTYCNKLYEKL